MQSTREFIEELGDLNGSVPHDELVPHDGGEIGENGSRGCVVCLPARDESDELIGLLLSQLLQNDQIACHSVPVGTSSEMMSAITEFEPDVVCISALPPFAIEYARNLYQKVHANFPRLNIVVCLWHFGGDLDKVHRRLKILDGDSVMVTLPDVIQHVKGRVRPALEAAPNSDDAMQAAQSLG
jgi:hypothetical protein